MCVVTTQYALHPLVAWLIGYWGRQISDVHHVASVALDQVAAQQAEGQGMGIPVLHHFIEGCIVTCDSQLAQQVTPILGTQALYIVMLEGGVVEQVNHGSTAGHEAEGVVSWGGKVAQQFAQVNVDQ